MFQGLDVASRNRLSINSDVVTSKSFILHVSLHCSAYLYSQFNRKTSQMHFFSVTFNISWGSWYSFNGYTV